ncbi:GDP-fucose protein O-fucosyltransferase [Cynara cardunculus var. scolymus]|uniref:O-fucosyltransferase family protein n=1 Tax=Cynara cardunculus var. scolymus TaxID=59895 RepID=A0A103Y7N6_CYNCS|nr:GDP-fucose protein O-fucosyltransferase [Cynara cardunculus var. scolymus]
MMHDNLSAFESDWILYFPEVIYGSILCSNFSEIFDVDWFISYLSKDVKIVKELPSSINGRVVHPYRTRVPRKCNQGCYQSRMVPLLDKRKAVMLTKFDYRLSNRLATNLQKLRCRANYHALRFTDPIVEMGKTPICLPSPGATMAAEIKNDENYNKFEDGGKLYMNPDRERRQGRCPLTPEEVGLMLRALGYGRDIHIYVASGEVYGGEDTLAPLKALFPNIHSKDTITSKNEMAPFLSYSSRMAALDFIVCDESDPTIRPNAKKLWRLFVDRNNMTWEEFETTTRAYQMGFMGEPNEVKPGRGEFHENPAACICENSESKSKSMMHSNPDVKFDEKNDVAEDEHDGFYEEDVEIEDKSRVQRLGTKNETDLGRIGASESGELEEIFSD